MCSLIIPNRWMTDGDDRDGDPDPLLVSRHSSVGGSSFFPSQRQDSLFMMTWIAGLLMVTIMSGLGSSASNAGADEKIVPMSVSFDPYGQQSQPYQPVYQPQPVYVQPVPQVPYNEALGPPNYGNAPGPSANAIAPEVNPYPRLSRCIITGYPCNSSKECCAGGCDIFGPASQCCIPEGQVCDFSRPTHPNNYACCYPLHCDPYKRNTGITVCQERTDRFPDSGMRLSPDPQQKRIKLPFAWYSDENHRYTEQE